MQDAPTYGHGLDVQIQTFVTLCFYPTYPHVPVSKSYVRERGVDTHRSVQNIRRMLALSIVRCQSCRLLLISTTKCVNLLYCIANTHFLLQKPCVYCRPSSSPFQSAGLGRTFSLKHFLFSGCYFPLCGPCLLFPISTSILFLLSKYSIFVPVLPSFR